VKANLPIADISGLSTYSLPHPKIVKMNSTTTTPLGTGSGSGGTYLDMIFAMPIFPM